MLSRRNFLKTAALAGTSSVLAPAGLRAQSRSAFTYQPDALVTLAGKQVPVDIALLGPNGEATAGFYASLDPFHGQAFGPGWRAVYGPLLRNGVHSTDPVDISRVLTHIQIHGIRKDDVYDIYRQAKQAWHSNPHLRTNHAGPPALEDPRTEDHDHGFEHYDNHSH